jgi:hypothetical protein
MIVGLLVGTSSAQAPTTQSETRDAKQLAEKLRRQLIGDGHTARTAVRNSSGGSVSAINKASFNTGSWFSFVISDVSLVGNMENPDIINATIADLVFLIDSLEGQPEAVTLQKTLRSFVRRTSTIEQILREIQTTYVSYSGRLAAEQKWYFTSGVVVTDLVISLAYQNNEGVMAGLSKTRGLIKDAPKGTSPDILEMLGSIVKFSSRTSLADADYKALFEGAFSIINLISA